MSHNFTQPEEIDHILMAMAGHDMEVDTPTPHGVQSSGVARNTGRDEFTKAGVILYDVVHSKSAPGLSDP